MPTKIQRAFESRLDAVSFPAAAAEVVRLCHQADVEFDDIVDAAERDVALAARLLELSNSSLFARAEQVCSVSEAVRFLGVRSVRIAAVTLLVKAIRSSQQIGVGEAYWRHAVLTAIAARGIAAVRKLAHPDEAFLAGLLMDMAYPLLLELAPPGYVGVVGDRDRGHPDEMAEYELLGIGHADLTGQLIQRWGLPDHIVAAVSGHHFPDTVVVPAKAGRLATALSLSHDFAQRLRRDDPPARAAQEIVSILVPEPGFGGPIIDAFLRTLGDSVRDVSAMLEVRVEDDPRLAEIIDHCLEAPTV